MGFDIRTGATEYDMTVFLTPKGVETFYNRGLVDGIKYFSISDHDVNYLVYSGYTYHYYRETGGDYTKGASPLPVTHFNDETLGYILNLRGSVDRDIIIDDRTLPTNVTSLTGAVVRYPDPEIPSDTMLSVYKLSNNDKVFDKSIVLGGRNMWHSNLSTQINTAEGFMYHIPPSIPTIGYTGTTEPTEGFVATGLTAHVPFPGVSVTNGERSYTEIQYFYFLNKTNTHMFVDSFVLRDIHPVSHQAVQVVIYENYSSEFVRLKYVLRWFAIKDGKEYIDSAINLYVPKFIYNKNREVLFPYEIVRFGVSFEIISPGSTIAHYRGQTFADQDVYESQYDFLVELRTKAELNSSTIYSAAMNVVVPVKDSGYDPNTYHPPVSSQQEKEVNTAID